MMGFKCFFFVYISCLNSKGYTIATRITIISIRLIKCIPYYIIIKGAPARKLYYSNSHYVMKPSNDVMLLLQLIM